MGIAKLKYEYKHFTMKYHIRVGAVTMVTVVDGIAYVLDVSAHSLISSNRNRAEIDASDGRYTNISCASRAVAVSGSFGPGFRCRRCIVRMCVRVCVCNVVCV